MKKNQITQRRLKNREKVRAFFAAHIGASQQECAHALGFSRDTVRHHLDDIRAEWRRRGPNITDIVGTRAQEPRQ